MFDMTLGSGIAIGSLFLTVGTIVIIYINNYFKSKQNCGEAEDCGGSNTTLENGYIRRGEYNQAAKTLQQQLESNHKENKNWWKQLDSKIDSVHAELSEIRKANDNHAQRISALEAVQKQHRG